MSLPAGKSPPTVLILAALTLLATLPSLLTRDLWNPDEPRYAQVAREMAVSGHYLVPHLNEEIYGEKPPLVFWMAAALQAVGIAPLAGRLITAAFALGLFLLVADLGRRWFGKCGGITSALVLGTSFSFMVLMRRGVLDVPLAFFCFLAFYAWVRSLTSLPGRPTLAWQLSIAVAAAAGVLTKGPVALLHIGLGLAAGALFLDLPRARATKYLLWVFPLTLGLVALWLVAAISVGGPEYADLVLFKQNLGRVVSSWSHRQPVYYYLPRLLLNLFPWILFAPSVYAFYRLQAKSDVAAVGKMLLSWFFAGVVVFSLISGKREVYLLPLYPAFALAVGGFLGRRLDDPAPLRTMLVPQSVWLAVGALPLLLLTFGETIVSSLSNPESQRIGREALGAPEFGRLVAVGILAAVLGGLGLVALRRLGTRRAVGMLMAQMAILGLAVDLWITPALNRYKSPRSVSERVLAEASPQPDSIATFPQGFSGAYNLYTGRTHLPTLQTPAEVQAFLASDAGNRVLASDEGLAMLEQDGSFEYRQHAAGRVGRRTIYLISAYPSAWPRYPAGSPSG